MIDHSMNRKILRVCLYIFITISSVFTLYPYFVMFFSSLKDLDQIFKMPPTIFPTTWKWDNYITVWKAVPLAKFFLNTFIVSIGATALTIVCAVPAAYALTRMEFKGRNLFMRLIVVSQMFTAVVLLIGIQRVLVSLGINDKTLLSLILVDGEFNQAFAVWILRGTFVTISRELEQAAMIDGCGRFEAMRRIVLPLAAPGIVTAIIYTFINAWNEYTVALTITSDVKKKVLTVGIEAFYGYTFVQWWYLFVVALLATIPVIILFMYVEKNLVSGLTAGGVKG